MMEYADATEWGLIPAFLWGVIWGSFFNVVIHRLPDGKSLSTPASHCPHCGNSLKAWHNIPIVSWLVLRAKCGFCTAPISIRYPLVEAVTGLLSMAIWVLVMQTDGGALASEVGPLALVGPFLLLFAFMGALVVITFIDLDLQIIPHAITLPFIVAGPIASLWLEPVTGLTWSHSILGAILGGGIIWLIIEAYFWVRKREGMGGGDFMMLAMLGSWLGFECLVFILLAASLQGLAAAGLLLMGPKVPESSDVPMEEGAGEEVDESFRYQAIPFGPFLALGGLEWLFFQPWIQEIIYGMYGLE